MSKNKKRIFIFSLIFICVLLLGLLNYNIYNKIKGTALQDYIINSSDNKVSIIIKDYDDTIGINNNETKRVIIKAKFNDNTKNKKIKINISDGLTYKTYPVLKSTNNIIQKEINEGEELFNVISSVDTPEIYNTRFTGIDDLRYSTFGDLVYYIKDNITEVEIPVNMKVDNFKYYGAKDFIKAINISIYEDEKEISNVSSNLKVYDANGFSVRLNNITYYLTNEKFPSTKEEPSYGNTNLVMLQVYNKLNNNSSQFPYFKNIKFYLYYPSGTMFEGVNEYTNVMNEDFIKKNNIIINNDPIERLVTVELNDYIYLYNGFGIKYKVNDKEDFNEYGKYYCKDANKIEVTFYDGTKKTFEFEDKKRNIYSVNVLDPMSFVNILNTNVSNHYDDSDDTTFVFGPMFRVINTTPGKKTNQTFELLIDSNYQAVGANFPTPKNESITDIEYKTNLNDTWVKYTKKHNDTYFGKKHLVLKENEFFTGIRVNISGFPENYQTGVAAAKSPSNLVVYGNLKSDGPDTANVILNIYDKNNPETRVTKKGVISRTNTSTVGFLEYVNFDKKTMNVNEKFHVNADLRTHSYPYGTKSYVDDPEIYIRQIKDITFDPNSIKIIDNYNNNIDYTIEKHANKFNEIIYKIKTKTRIGNNLTQELINKSLKVSLDFKVNLDADIPSISIKDIFGWGNNNFEPVSYWDRALDIYDMDCDNNYDDYINIPYDTSISILPSKSVNVSSNIIKDGIINPPYDENIDSTIINVGNKDGFKYSINIQNKTDKEVNYFNLYLPIPKNNMFYGEEFQKSKFNWDMTLNEIPNINDNFDIYYLTDESLLNNKDIEEVPFLKEAPSNLDDIKMLKIVSNKPIESGASYKLNIELLTNESRKSTETKKGLLNIWNPVYYIKMPSMSGVFKGVGVGLKLNSYQINGKMFLDNNGNGEFDKEVDENFTNTNIKLYKKYNNDYKLIDNVLVSYDLNNKEYFIDNIEGLQDGTYGLKFDIPNGYHVSLSNLNNKNSSKADIDGWIYDIKLNDSFNKNIGFVKYDLDFDIDDIILLKDNEETFNIKNIKPKYFDNIKNPDTPIDVKLIDEEDSTKINIELLDSYNFKLKGLEDTDNLKLKASIYDKYGFNKEKIFNVKIKSDPNPTFDVKDQHIYVGEEIKYKEYISNVLNYKEEKIDLIWEGKEKNIEVLTNVPNTLNIATKEGAYNVIYTVKDGEYKTTKTIRVVVDNRSGIINPSTGETNIIFILSHIIGLLITIILIIRNRK